MYCKYCGTKLDDNVIFCSKCGKKIGEKKAYYEDEIDDLTPKEEDIFYKNDKDTTYDKNETKNKVNKEEEEEQEKSKMVAGLLAILLGGFGIHKFYLGDTKKGILYLFFSWSYIPFILSFIEGIQILCESDKNFKKRIVK